MADLTSFVGPNAGYVLDLYERFLQDPASVDAGWQEFFRSFTPPAEGAVPAGASAGGYDLDAVVAAHELAEAIRARGHTAARLSPIAPPADPDPALLPEAHGITQARLAGLPAAVVRGPAGQGARNAARGSTACASCTPAPSATSSTTSRTRGSATGCASGGVGQPSAPLTPEKRRALLARLSQVEGFERFLHKAFSARSASRSRGRTCWSRCWTR